jgi:hypothetical protein
MTERERLLGELRPGAFALAYRMVGSVSEADELRHLGPVGDLASQLRSARSSHPSPAATPSPR